MFIYHPHSLIAEYGAGKILEEVKSRSNIVYKDELHLAVSSGSFRGRKCLSYS